MTDSLREYKILEPADTLKELRDRIDEAILLCGENAPWNGYDDGMIYIHPKDKQWVCIPDGDK